MSLNSGLGATDQAVPSQVSVRMSYLHLPCVCASE